MKNSYNNGPKSGPQKSMWEQIKDWFGANGKPAVPHHDHAHHNEHKHHKGMHEAVCEGIGEIGRHKAMCIDKDEFESYEGDKSGFRKATCVDINNPEKGSHEAMCKIQ